jgi:predicted protein tyrosine phosphatase
MIYVYAVSRDEVEHGPDPAGNEDKIIVSITDPETRRHDGSVMGGRFASIVFPYKSVCRLMFDDWHGERLDGFRVTNGRDPIFFTHDMALDVCQFISGWHVYVRHLLIHCEAGVSRSVGMALAVMDHYGVEAGGPDEFVQAAQLNRTPRSRGTVGNPLVYWLMRAALREIS